MARELDHIALANKNHHAMLCLLGPACDHLEWVVTIGFYKAIHIVEAVFDAQKCGDSTSHRDRRVRLRTHNPAIFKDFEHLYTASRIARYLAASDDARHTQKYRTFTDYLSVESAKRLLSKRLYRIEQMSLRLLSENARGLLLKISPTDFQ